MSFSNLTNPKRLSLGLLSVCLLQTFWCIAAPRDASAQGRVSVSTPCSPPAFLCNGVLQNEAPIYFVIFDSDWQIDGNITPDSIIVRGDSNFTNFFGFPPGVEIYGADIFYGAMYAPSSFGTDTLWVGVYYSGTSASAAFPFSPLQSPDVGLLGYTTFSCYFSVPDSNGNTILSTGGSQLELVTDTIHDIMNEDWPYNSPGSTQSLGENTQAQLDACAGAIIDSITFESDFSEFTFLDLPSFPAVLPPGDSLVLHYQITPSIVGTHKRPMVFHVHGADPLVWSFEYSVQSASLVQPVATNSTALRLYPNPLSSSATLYYSLDVEQPVSLSVYSVLGQKVWERSEQDEGAGSHLDEIDLSGQPAGIYFLRLEAGNESASIPISKE